MVMARYYEVKRDETLVSRFKAGVQDIVAGLMFWRVWTAFAWENIQRTYHRTLLGALWISVSFLIFVGVKVIVFGTLLGSANAKFGAMLMLGFLGWQFINQCVMSAPNVFVANAGWIKNDPLPFSVYVFQSVTQDMYSFLMTLVAVVGLYWTTGQSIDIYILLAFPAVFMILFNAFWIKMSLGVISTRFRDVGQFVTSIMRIMIFLTPVFWTPEQMGERLMSVLWWNPIMHFIDILRYPIIAHGFPEESWVYVGWFTLGNLLFGFLLFGLFRRRIAFWL